MKKSIFLFSFLAIFIFSFTSCEEDSPNNNNNGAKVKFKFVFDENQTRLNNIGLPATIPNGNATQTPDFHALSVHFIELAPQALTPMESGMVVHNGVRTSAGGADAVDFDQALVSGENEVFLEIPISDFTPGTYEWARTSITYQNYTIDYNVINAPFDPNICGGSEQSGTIASFLGYNTYITDTQVKNQSISVNDDKTQGFWAFETDLGGVCAQFNQVNSGEAPAGATTVVNPFAAALNIPPNSCIIVGEFDTPLQITGNETEDITVTLSYSIKESLEWIDNTPNGLLDIDLANPANSDIIVDMGLRGLLPSWE
ncbi:MAG: hypothetical protein ACPG5P_01630 [Saprospiraceae bacterium]